MFPIVILSIVGVGVLGFVAVGSWLSGPPFDPPFSGPIIDDAGVDASAVLAARVGVEREADGTVVLHLPCGPETVTDVSVGGLSWSGRSTAPIGTIRLTDPPPAGLVDDSHQTPTPDEDGLVNVFVTVERGDDTRIRIGRYETNLPAPGEITVRRVPVSRADLPGRLAEECALGSRG